MPHSSADPPPVRVAIVDDSPTIRKWLGIVLTADSRLDVVLEAEDAFQAIELMKSISVDVMVLDVDMPGMSGLEFLTQLMQTQPLPVVMFSALTEHGSDEAVEALSLGAIDCILKPRNALTPELANLICHRVWQASQASMDRFATRQRRVKSSVMRGQSRSWRGPIILLGASTGGVSALENVMQELEGIPNPVVIAQHMPENFLRSFCQRLNTCFTRRFRMAEDGVVLKSGQAIVCLGKTVSTRLQRGGDGLIHCTLSEPSEETVFRPSVDDLFLSAAQGGFSGTAALLTGMGSDGARGMLALRRAGFQTLAQNEQSCVVFGMPRAAIEFQAVQEVLTDQAIGQKLARDYAVPIRAGAGVLV